MSNLIGADFDHVLGIHFRTVSDFCDSFVFRFVFRFSISFLNCLFWSWIFETSASSFRTRSLGRYLYLAVQLLRYRDVILRSLHFLCSMNPWQTVAAEQNYGLRCESCVHNFPSTNFAPSGKRRWLILLPMVTVGWPHAQHFDTSHFTSISLNLYLLRNIQKSLNFTKRRESFRMKRKNLHSDRKKKRER